MNPQSGIKDTTQTNNAKHKTVNRIDPLRTDAENDPVLLINPKWNKTNIKHYFKIYLSTKILASYNLI